VVRPLNSIVRHMSRPARVVHIVATSLVLLVCLVMAYDTYNYFGEAFVYAYKRIAVALLCGALSAAHLALAVKNRLTRQAFVLFYPLCGLLGVTTGIVAWSSAKNWGDATTEEAYQASLVGYLLVATIALMAAASWYRSLVTTRDSRAQHVSNSSLERPR
jgi:hypothetical protein